MQDLIHCPSCGYEITVAETLTAQIRQHLRQELDAEAKRKEHDLAKRTDELRQREKSLADEVANLVAQERSRLANEAATQAKDAVAVELLDLREQLHSAKVHVSNAQKTELMLRKERRQIEDEKQTLELTVSRTLDVERTRIRDDAKRETEESHRLRDADNEKQIGDLRRQINELKRKSEQGSPQAQGEVMEIILEDLLRQYFPLDGIVEVPVGVHGGDVIHSIFDATGEPCGKILWESKRTKAWSDTWLPKLREDQRAAKAHLAILVTTELPKGVASFTCIDGVWVTKREYVVGLTIALRSGLLEIARTRRSMAGQQTKMEYLYQFLVGPEFQQRVEGIIDAFASMKEDLDSERRSIMRLWAKREKQIERAMANTTGLHGDFTSILGANLPQVGCLELSHIPIEAEETMLEKAPWD